MEHYAKRTFWDRYKVLPPNIRVLADKNFMLLKENPKHPSLRLKKVGRFWTVRIGLDYRAVSVEIEEGLLWIWIGPHTEYDILIRS